MTIYRIRYGMAGGYGGCGEWEEIEARSYEEALDYAMECASEEYYNSPEYYNTPEPESIEDEYDDIDSWIIYEAEKV